MAKRKADDEDLFEPKLGKTEESDITEQNTPSDGKSKRVRKKSAKLLEMEEYEVFEKKIFKNPSKGTTSANSTKTLKKVKVKPDVLSVSGLDSLADVATAELNTEEHKPLISGDVKVSEQSSDLSFGVSKPLGSTMSELSINTEKPPKAKPVKLKTVSPSAVTNPSPVFIKPDMPKLKPPKPKQSFEDQLIGPDTIAVQNKAKIKKVKKTKPVKDKPANVNEHPADENQSKGFINGQEPPKVKPSLCLPEKKPEQHDSDFRSDEDQPAIWPSEIKEESNDILVKLKKKKVKKTKPEVDKQGLKKDGAGDELDNNLMKYSAVSDGLPANEGQLEIDLERKQDLKAAKKKRLKKLNEHSAAIEQTLNDQEIKEDFDEEGCSPGAQPASVYSNTEVMAMKLKTSSEKKASGSSTKMKEKRFRRRGPTAYTMFSNNYRTKVLAENPGIDFAQISKRLGEIWQCLPAKEKMMWKRKARQRVNKIKKLNNGGTTDSISDMVFTSKVPSVFKRPSASVPGKAKTAPKSQAKQQPVKLSAAKSPDVTASTLSSSSSSSSSSSPSAAAATAATSSSSLLGQLLTSHSQEKVTSDSAHVAMHKADENVPCNPIDVAAHLKLLGDSLQTIGFRLQEHKGPIAVQGSLSVLLDSSLCAMASVMCLTNQLPEIHTALNKTHSRNLDNIAYIMPGIG